MNSNERAELALKVFDLGLFGLCLRYLKKDNDIDDIDNVLWRENIFSCKVISHFQESEFDDVLTLQRRQNEEFHHDLSIRIWHIFAESNRLRENLLEAYNLYKVVQRMLIEGMMTAGVDVDVRIRDSCLRWIEELRPSHLVQFSDVEPFSFEMSRLSDTCFTGIMNSFPKSFIKVEDHFNFEGSSQNKNHLSVDFVMMSKSLSCKVVVLEPVRPIMIFFELKRESFKNARQQTPSNWWNFIHSDFNHIFRGIISGLIGIHSKGEVCTNLEELLYVTEKGDGKIFHKSRSEFSIRRGNKDLTALATTMNNIITMVKSRTNYNPDLADWVNEYNCSYNLPLELVAFLQMLGRKRLHSCIPSSWVLNHPYWWSVNLRLSFLRSVHLMIRGESIDGKILCSMLGSEFQPRPSLWTIEVAKDPLLHKIYMYHGDLVYVHGSGTIITFINAVFSHINDSGYKQFRLTKGKAWTLEEALNRILKIFPNLFNQIHEGFCNYAKFQNLHLMEVVSTCLSFV